MYSRLTLIYLIFIIFVKLASKSDEKSEKDKPNKRIYIKHNIRDSFVQLNELNQSKFEKSLDKIPVCETSSIQSLSPTQNASNCFLRNEKFAKNTQNMELNESSDSIFEKCSTTSETYESKPVEPMMQALKSFLAASSSPSTSTLSPTALTLKVNTLNTINLFKCNNCKLMFVDKHILIDHRNYCSYNSASKIYSEQICCDNLKELFKCSFCDSIYQNKCSYMSHVLLCSSANSL